MPAQVVGVLVKKFLQNEIHLQNYLTSHRPFWKLSPYLDLMVITMYYLIICSLPKRKQTFVIVSLTKAIVKPWGLKLGAFQADSSI